MSFKDAFALHPEGEKPKLTEKQAELLDKLAKKVIEYRMTVPAIMFLETVKPLSYIGSQTMVFFEPMVKAVFNVAEYDEFRIILEDRRNVEELLVRIERFDREALDKENATRKEKRFFGWFRRKKSA
ncbi:MAG TPA: hypothetical protein VFR89_05175 [candidate division Zixibacteria bacterium]|nr:hypothetical protein [candidate division Zixibacteria bacterium]